MSDQDLKDNIAEQNKRKLQEHLENLKKYGGKPPPEPEKKEQAKPQPSREEQQFRQDWEAWKRIYRGKVIDLTAKPVEDLSRDYKLLGIPPTATKMEIKKAFYALAKENHPDKGGKVEVFRELMDAYTRLNQDD